MRLHYAACQACLRSLRSRKHTNHPGTRPPASAGVLMGKYMIVLGRVALLRIRVKEHCIAHKIGLILNSASQLILFSIAYFAFFFDSMMDLSEFVRKRPLSILPPHPR